MNIAVDLHDTLTYAPFFFAQLLRSWRGKRYVVTGTPPAFRKEVARTVRDCAVAVDGILMGFPYKRKDMNAAHFRRMAAHKLDILKEHEVQVYFDDNPFYAEHMRRHGVLVFQTILPPKHRKRRLKRDPFETSHLQDRQFDFLADIP